MITCKPSLNLHLNLIGVACTMLVACGGSSGGSDDIGQGELRRAPSGNQTSPPPQTTGTLWLMATPKQCRSNPWETPATPDSMLQGEAGSVDTFFKGKGIPLAEIGFLERPPSEFPGAVCAACQCPRGDRLVVRVKSQEDARRLEREFEFGRVSAGSVERESISCNMNPWDPNRDTAATAKDLGHWATTQGADVVYAGFVATAEPFAACRSCTCSNGERAIVLAKDEESADKLRALEFKTM